MKYKSTSSNGKETKPTLHTKIKIPTRLKGNGEHTGKGDHNKKYNPPLR